MDGCVCVCVYTYMYVCMYVCVCVCVCKCMCLYTHTHIHTRVLHAHLRPEPLPGSGPLSQALEHALYIRTVHVYMYAMIQHIEGRCRRPLSMPYMDTVYTLVHGLKSAMIQDTYGRCRRPCGMPCRIEHVPVVYISDANHVYLCVHVSHVHQSGHGHHTRGA